MDDITTETKEEIEEDKTFEERLVPFKREKKDVLSNTIVALFYGPIMVGKTTFGNTFPNPLFLNTDGNIQNVDAVVYKLYENEWSGKDKWNYFKWTIDELIKNKKSYIKKGYKTVIIDTIDHIYEWNENNFLAERGWDDFPKNDYGVAFFEARRQFLKVFQKILDDLKEFNIILLGHEVEIQKSDGIYTTTFKEPFVKQFFMAKKLNFKIITSKCGIIGELSKNSVGETVLKITPNNTSEVGNRYGNIDDIIEPTYDKMIEGIKNPKSKLTENEGE